MRNSFTISAMTIFVFSFMVYPLQGAVEYKVIKRLVLDRTTVQLGEYYDATTDNLLYYNVCTDQLEKGWITVAPVSKREESMDGSGNIIKDESSHDAYAEQEISVMLGMVPAKLGGHLGNLTKYSAHVETEMHALDWRTNGFLECVDKDILATIQATHFVSEITWGGRVRMANKTTPVIVDVHTSFWLDQLSGSDASEEISQEVISWVTENNKKGLPVSMSLTPIGQLREYMQVKTANDGIYVALDEATIKLI